MADDQATAMALAWKNRRPVEILSERTELSQTFAQPDGTLRNRTFAKPQRVRRGTDWVPINTNLVYHADGYYVPLASTLDLRLSPGGPGTLLTMVKDNRMVSMTWPYPLPSPRILNNKATYRNVLPDLDGVDLEIEAHADSYTQVLVVRNAVAARDSRLASLQFRLALQGLTLRQDSGGFLRFVDSADRAVFVSDGASMWQSSAVPPGEIDPEGGGSARSGVRPIPVTVTADTLTVTPSQEVLTNPNAQFPLYIDPGFNGGTEIWTHVSRKNPTRSYWTDSNRADMRVGQLWGGDSDDDWRTIVQFDVSKLKGATIKSAAVLVSVRHTGDCTLSPFQLWRTNAIDRKAAVTWNNTKGKWWQVLGEVNATANKSSCPKGNDAVKFAQTAVRKAFQDAASKNLGTMTLAFRARSESDKYQWKKLTAGSTYLDIDYNHTPGTPSGLSFGPCYLACASPAVTSSPRPSLTMKATDSNGGTLRYEYEVYDSARTTQLARSANTVTGVAVGSARTWSLKTALPAGDYFWRGRACDSYLCGSYSGWYSFRVDTTNPRTPTVTSDVYSGSGWNGAPGQAAEFWFRPGRYHVQDAVSRYTYSLNGAAEVSVTPSFSSIALPMIKPTKDMVNTLRVKTIDAAGNVSGGVDYRFKVRPVGDSWSWGLDEGTGTTSASSPINNRPLTASGTGVTWETASKDGAAARTFTGTGELATESTVVNTRSPSGLSVGAWVRLPAPEPVVSDNAGGGDGTEPQPGDPSGDDPESEQTPEDNSEASDPTPPLPTGNLTAVSQDGAHTSAFRLGYRADLDLDADQINDPAWCFTVAGTDTAAPASTSACTYSYVEPGAWVHLVGIVDPIKGRIKLYVNGIPARDGVLAELPGVLNWESTGKFSVGRGWTAGAPDQRWTGSIDEVQVTPRIWTEQEIYDKARVADGGTA